MVFIKRSDSKNPLEVLVDSHSFSKGTRFMMDGLIWTVVGVEGDTNAPMRRCASSQGDDEMQLLATLRDYLKKPHAGFALLDPIKELQDKNDD